MTLVECVFKRSKEQRICIQFAALSKECRVPSTEVEHLVMKALSLGLIKGQIDEVDQTVQVSNLYCFIDCIRLLGSNLEFLKRHN